MHAGIKLGIKKACVVNLASLIVQIVIILAVMKAIYLVLTFLLCIKLSNSSAASADKESEDRCDDDCSFYSSYHGDWYQLKCTSSSVQLSIGYCMTVDANENLFVTKCPYFQLEVHNVSDPGNFKLPGNASELNEYTSVDQ